MGLFYSAKKEKEAIQHLREIVAKEAQLVNTLGPILDKIETAPSKDEKLIYYKQFEATIVQLRKFKKLMDKIEWKRLRRTVFKKLWKKQPFLRKQVRHSFRLR